MPNKKEIRRMVFQQMDLRKTPLMMDMAKQSIARATDNKVKSSKFIFCVLELQSYENWQESGMSGQ